MSTPGGYREPHRGTLIMVLGILSIFVAQIILGPIAWIMGTNDLKKMRSGQMDPEGESQTNTGRICGMVGTIIGVASCCIVLAVWGAMFGFIARDVQQQQPIIEDVAPRERQVPPERPD